MAEALRRRDRIDVAPRWTADDAIRLDRDYAGATAADLIAAVAAGGTFGPAAVVSSFGTESAVLLDLVARVDRTMPVLFLDTGRHFPETLAYRDAIVARLRLSDVRSVSPDPADLAARDAAALRWSYDPDGCCALRKVAPLEKTLAGFAASVTGRKAFQADTRAALPRVELDGERLKINPLARWTRDDLAAYFRARDLPRHPLEARGFASIGCAPCTSAVRPGEDPRAGRWRGWDKTECGLHAPTDGAADQPSF